MAGKQHRRRSRSLPLWLGAAFAAASCSSNGTNAIPTTLPPTPSAVLSSALDAAQAAFCDHVDDLQVALADLQADPSPDLTSVTTTLDSLSANLRSDADALQQAGHPDQAGIAGSAASAVESLRTLLANSTTLPSGFDTAVAAVGAVLAQLPQSLCPAPTP